MPKKIEWNIEDLPEEYDILDDHLLRAVKRYVEDGDDMGGFLEAVFANDLYKAIGHADNTRVKTLKEWVLLVWNRTPLGCRGSDEKIEAWKKARRMAANA